MLVMEKGLGYSINDWRKKKRPGVVSEIAERMSDGRPSIQYIIPEPLL